MVATSCFKYMGYNTSFFHFMTLGGKGTLLAQRTSFNTLENWGHKTPTQSKRIKDRKEKIKGSWPGTRIQYTRLQPNLLAFSFAVATESLDEI